MDKQDQANLAHDDPAAKDPLDGWSEEDRKWLEGLPTEIRAVAQRHGRFTFEMVMACGAATESLNQVIQTKPPRQAIVALGVLNRMLQQIAAISMTHAGITGSMFNECKADFERASLLAMGSQQQGEARSAGGIILNG